MATAGPDLRPVDDVLVPVAYRPRAEVGQVRTGFGLGEHLAPKLLPGEDPVEVPSLLLLGASQGDGGRRPADADRVLGAAHPVPSQLLVNEDLVHRTSVDPVRSWPVGHHVAGVVELAGRRFRVIGEPLPDGKASGIVVSR